MRSVDSRRRNTQAEPPLDLGKYVVGYEGPGWTISPSNIDQTDGIGYVGAIVVRDARDGSIVATRDIRNVTDLAISPDSATMAYGVGFHQTYVARAAPALRRYFFAR